MPHAEAAAALPDGSAADIGKASDDGATSTNVDSAAIDSSLALGYCTSKPAVAGAIDLSGVWVAKLTGAQIVTSGVTKAIHNKNVYYQLLTIQQAGTTLTVDGRYCDRTEVNDPGAIVPVQIPEAWAHTETPIHRAGDFAPAGGAFPVLTLPSYFEAIGATLTSTDALPTTASDSRVFDEDKDGNPGITIRLSGLVNGSVYSVQTQTTSVTAVAVASNRMEGALVFASNQTVLASNPSTIATLYASSTTTSDNSACASTFVMVKLAGAAAGAQDGGSDVTSDVTCAWVRTNETALFQ